MPVILDGAQGAGAIEVDVKALGCVAYAAAGQKWLCGADGTGMLYLQPEFGERIRTIMPGYMSFEDASKGLDSTLRAEARRFDGALPREAVAFSAEAAELLRQFGWDEIFSASHDLADKFADALRASGREVAPRGRSTLVSFVVDDPEAKRVAADREGRGPAQPARPSVPARVGRRLERRVRPRAPARRALDAGGLRLLRVERRQRPRVPRGHAATRRRARRRRPHRASTAAPRSG